MKQLEPFKIVGQLIGVNRDDDGEIIGEEVIGEVAIYRPNFHRVDELINEALSKDKGP